MTKKKALISPSILAAPHTTQEEVQTAIRIAEEGGADLIHIDVMDGIFVEETTMWNDPAQIRTIKTSLPLDVHIMIANPDERYQEFIDAGASLLAFHLEAAKDPETLLSKMHRAGVKAGVSINPETPIEKVYPYLSLLDYVLIMSVHPGKAGQRFLPAAAERIAKLKQEAPTITVQVDGGINPETARLVKQAGADIIVAGADIYRSRDPKAAIQALKQA